MTTAKSDAKVREISVEQLVLSPEETRKTIDQAALAELASSIRLNGVIEALLVRLGGDETHFEIVAGQRRWLASKIAGKKTCPCIVREMSDDEARELRVVSNLQREDLPAMEEAVAFRELLRVPGSTIESVAAKLGKAASYIGRRLKLLDAIEPVREALKAAAIDVGHALELARLMPAQQTRMLSWLDVGFIYREPREVEEESGYAIADSSDDDAPAEDEKGVCRYCGCDEHDACFLEDGNCSWANQEETVCSNPDCLAQWNADRGNAATAWRPTRWSMTQLRAEIACTTLKVLSDAPFPLDDEIPPVACTDCPKRSVNAMLLFADCAQDTCTDRDCFDGKVRAWVRHELEQSDKLKQKLLMLSDGWSSKQGVIPDYSVVVAQKQNPIKPCNSQEEAIYIDGPRAGHRTMICRESKCKVHQSESKYTGPASNPEKAKAARKKLLAKVDAEKKYRAALFAAVAKAPVSARFESELNLEVSLCAIGRGPGQYEKKVAEALGWPEGIFGWNGAKQLRERVTKLTPAERLRVALLAAHAGELGVNEYALGSKPQDLERLAGLLGLDVKKIRAGSVGRPKAEAAKPEKASTAKKASKPVAKKAVKAAKPAKKRVKKGGRK